MSDNNWVSMDQLYESGSDLVFMVDFGQFHPAFADDAQTVECDADLIHEAYSK